MLDNAADQGRDRDAGDHPEPGAGDHRDRDAGERRVSDADGTCDRDGCGIRAGDAEDGRAAHVGERAGAHVGGEGEDRAGRLNWRSRNASSIPAPILDEIRAAGGCVTFARFMELALTHPAAGYYTGARSPLGSAGDFITVPQRSPFFNHAVGRLLAELARAAAAAPAAGGRARIVEVGPGEGDMAAGILRYFEDEAPDLKDICWYQLVEPGPRLRELQEGALRPAIERGWRVEWADVQPQPLMSASPRLPSGPPGILITNELLDALPVHIVDVRGEEPLEAWVQLSDQGEGGITGPGLEVRWRALSAEAQAELEDVGAGARGVQEWTRDGFVELRPATRRFLRDAVDALGSGFVVTIDYGAWRASAEVDMASVPSSNIKPQLHELTVRGYFRHQRQEDPLCRIGEQDLTADVDFAALDRTARDLGFETILFLQLSDFLAAAGGREELASLASSSSDRLAADAAASLLEALLDPAGVGGLFKLMVQVRE